MTGQAPDDLLMGGGATFFSTAAKNNIGQFVTKPYGQQGRTYISGWISSIGEVQQQTDYTTGALLTWTDGKPRQQFPIIIDVDWQNTLDWKLENNQWVQAGPTAADDTQRGIMIKQSSDLQGKLKDAIKSAGADGIRVGAYITVELVGEVPGQGNPRKNHAVTYQPPAPQQNAVMGMEQGQPQPPAPTPGGAGAPQQGYQQQPQAPQQAQQGYPPQEMHPQAPAPMPQQPMQQAPAPAPMPQQGYQQPPAPQVPAQQPMQQQGGYVRQPQQMPPQQPMQAPPQQQAPAQNQQDPTVIARKLLHELNLPAEQVAQQTGLPLETVQQLPPF